MCRAGRAALREPSGTRVIFARPARGPAGGQAGADRAPPRCVSAAPPLGRGLRTCATPAIRRRRRPRIAPAAGARNRPQAVPRGNDRGTAHHPVAPDAVRRDHPPKAAPDLRCARLTDCLPSTSGRVVSSRTLGTTSASGKARNPGVRQPVAASANGSARPDLHPSWGKGPHRACTVRDLTAASRRTGQSRTNAPIVGAWYGRPRRGTRAWYIGI